MPSPFHSIAIPEGKAGVGEGLPEVVSGETVRGGMEKDVLRNEVLVQGRVELFEEIDPFRLQDAGDLRERRAPVLDMVEDAEAEDGVHGPRLHRQGGGISGEEEIFRFSASER